MKLNKIIYILLLLPFIGQAETFKTESELIPFTNSVMEKIGKGDMELALNMIKLHSTVPKSEIDAMLLTTQSLRKKNKGQIGKSVGYDFLGKKKVGLSMFRVVYLEKTEKVPITWEFIFYKNNAGWSINTFTFQSDPKVPFYHHHD